MSNIINVKEERNVLSFDGEVFDIVANSTNFYLKFTLDEEWSNCSIITAIFNLDGEKYFTELDSNQMCQIPATHASKLLFCITAEPDKDSKLSSTILSLNVEPSGCTCLEDVMPYEGVHKNLLGLIGNLQSGVGINAEYANIAGSSQTQVSLTGDETVAGEKNFLDRIKYQDIPIPNFSEISNPNLLINSSFRVNQHGSTKYTREGTDIVCLDRWILANGDGSFHKTKHELECTDETNPIMLYQRLEEDQTSANLFEKTLTLSATIAGERVFGSFTMPTSDFRESDLYFNIRVTDEYAFRVYYKYIKKQTSVQFLVNPGFTVDIHDVKLEISDHPTRYIERSYNEEYTLCQRYYQKLRVHSVGYAADSTKIRVFVPTPATIRTALSIRVAALPLIIANDGTEITPTDLVVQTVHDNGVLCWVYGEGFVEGMSYTVVNGNLYIDGEVY